MRISNIFKSGSQRVAQYMAMRNCVAEIPQLAQIQKTDFLKSNSTILPNSERANNLQSLLFWVGMQFMLAVVYGRQTVQDLDCLTLEDWTDMLPRNVDKQIPTHAA